MSRALPVFIVFLSAIAGRLAWAETDVRPLDGGADLVRGAGFFVLTLGAEARLYASDGQPLGAIGRAAIDDSGDRDGGEPEISAGKLSLRAREDILESLDVPEEAFAWAEADDLVEEETSLADRRRARERARTRPVPSPAAGDRSNEPAPGAPDERGEASTFAAGSPESLWVIAGGDLWRSDGSLPFISMGRTPGGVRALALAPDGALFVATDTEILVRAVGASRFSSLERLETPPARLVVSPSGTWLAWSSPEPGRVQARSPTGAAHRWTVDQPVLDLAFCEQRLVVLGQERIFLARADGALAPLGPNPGGGRLVCPPVGAGATADGPSAVGPGWAVVGPGLWLSADRGRSFGVVLDPGHAGPTVAAALAPTGLWLALADGRLVSLSDGWPSPDPSPVLGPSPTPLGPDQALALRVLGRSSFPPWAGLLPRLGVTAGLDQSLFGRDFRAFAFAEVPLSLPAPPRFARPPGRARLAQVDWRAPEPAPAEPSSPALWSPAFPDSPHRDGRCLSMVRRAAVARALVEPERAASMLARAGRAAWLPELRFRVERRIGRSESFDIRPTAANPTGETLGFDAGDDVRYEVRAIWDLPSLVFSHGEISAAQQALRMADMRGEIESQVNRLFFERRRLLERPSEDPTLEPQARLASLEELAAELDALSGGALARCERGRSELR